jgi:hypothetical protein
MDVCYKNSLAGTPTHLSLSMVHLQEKRPAFITSDHEHASAAQMLKYRKNVKDPKKDTHLVARQHTHAATVNGGVLENEGGLPFGWYDSSAASTPPHTIWPWQSWCSPAAGPSR